MAAESARQSPVDEALVRRLAELANLELQPDELVALTSDLDSILAYVRILEEADVAGVPPLASVRSARPAERADEPAPSLPRDVAFGQAPRVDREDGKFVVPAFVDEG